MKSLLAVLLLLAACGRRETPQPPAPAAHHPDSAAALRRCAGGVAQAASMPPADQPTVFMPACRSMYARAACRDAWAARPGPGRDEAIVRACADAYCPDLPAPKPPLCADAPADVRAGWPALDEAILRFDHGPLEAPGREFLATFARRPKLFVAP